MSEYLRGYAIGLHDGGVKAQPALSKALNLALLYLARLEPGDSRAVSDEFVAMAAVASGDTAPEVMRVIDEALVVSSNNRGGE